jgi:uncharacterized cupredoxin-like copper-binding protein
VSLARLGSLVPAVLAAALLAACGAASGGATEGGNLALLDETPGERIALEMLDVRFEPVALEVAAGELVAIELSNPGSILHDFTLERLEGEHGYRIEGEPPRSSGAGRAVHVRLRPGTTGELRLRIDVPGEYVFFCDVPGHRRAGMVGTVTVR